MKRIFRPVAALVLLSLLLGAPQASALDRDAVGIEGSDGPIPVRILSPLGLRFFQFSPDRAASRGRGAWSVGLTLSESNVLHAPREGDREFTTAIDLELTRVNLSLERGLTPSWDLGIELPLMSTHGGFLDPLIRDVEGAVGKLKPRRRDEDQGLFAYRLARDGDVFFEGRKTAGLGDVAFTAKHFLAEQQGGLPALALRAAVKLPTGDRDAGFSSGLVDLGIGVAAEWDAFPWLMTAGTQLTIPFGKASGMAGLETLPVASAYFEAGYRATAKISLHLQLAARTALFGVDLTHQGSPLDAQSRESLTGDVVQVTPAVGWRLSPGYTLFFGMAEDFMSSEDAASDVTFFTTVRRGFGGRGSLP